MTETGKNAFPSLKTSSRSRSVSISVRMPPNLAKELEKVCKQNAVGQSELVRDFISAGLTELEHRADQLPQAPVKDAVPENSLNPFEDLAGTWTFGSADDYINELREGWD